MAPHLEWSGKAVLLMSVTAFAYCRVFTSVAIYLSIALHEFQSLASGCYTLFMLHNIYTAQKKVISSVLKGSDMLEKNAWHWKSYGLALSHCKTVAYYEVWGKTFNMHLTCVKSFCMTNRFKHL